MHKLSQSGELVSNGEHAPQTGFKMFRSVRKLKRAGAAFLFMPETLEYKASTWTIELLQALS